MIEIAFVSASLPSEGGLVLLGLDPERLGTLGTAADYTTGGAVARGLAAARFKYGKAESCTLLGPGGGLSRIVVLGLGKLDERTTLLLEQAGGRAASAMVGEAVAAVDASGLDATDVAHVALGAVLRAYRFDRYRTKEKPEDKPVLARLSVLADAPEEAAAAYEHLRVVADGVFLARDLSSEPPNVLNPAEFARRIEGLRALGLEVEVLEPAALQALGFGALLGVAQGSANEARVAVMQWKGGEDGAAPIAFIGKGVTFDSGGISIKPAGGMEDMKWDMAGAGTVTGLMAALAGRGARVNVVGVVGLVENMPSGTAQRPSDVVTTASGQTVEIINTDAEGRMVLADVLWYCQDRFKPRFMVDLATLTGAVIVSLGHEYAGMFCNNDELATNLAAAASATGEKLWRLPLGEAYDKQLASDIADMKHTGGRPGSAITAACFLQRFTNSVPWAHLDVAGTVWATKDSAVCPKGATAFGVRLLDRMVADAYEA